MNMNEVVVCIREYPDGDKPYRTLNLKNHWNFKDRVVMSVLGELEHATFCISDLRKALDAVEAAK